MTSRPSAPAVPLPSGESWLTKGLLAALLIGALIYVGNAWSPSSYAIALRYFGVQNDGLVAGHPQVIRADEWAVFTPQVQAVVNNGFARHNETSYYREDLRWVFSLPIRDWGMVFKPTQWGYAILPPAYAFSLNFYLLAALFLSGYHLLFIRLGARPSDALLLSILLQASAYVQSWWTAVAAPLAFFPWLMLLAFAAVRSPRLAIPAFYWCTVCWMLGFFYPPLIIGLALAGAGILWLGDRQVLRSRTILWLLAALIAASLTVLLYLRDYLLATWGTHYPGQRISHGGGVPWQVWLSQFFPLSLVGENHTPLLTDNFCAIASAGSYFSAFALCFLNHGALRQAWRARHPDLLALAPATGVLLLMWLWMLAPLPHWTGMPLLLHRVPPERLEFPAALLFLLIAYRLVRLAGLSLTLPRALLFTALAALSWRFFKESGTATLLGGGLEAAAVLAVWLLCLPVFRKHQAHGNETQATALLATAAAISMLAFLPYNPLQSAHPIFTRESTAVSRELDRIVRDTAASEPRPTLAVPGFFGAVLNGWGYPSVAHVLPAPRMDLWHSLFPALDGKQRDTLFNRFAHIALSDAESVPRLVRFDAVFIPRAHWDNRHILFPRRIVPLRGEPGTLDKAGYIDRVRVHPDGKGTTLRIEGWAPFRGASLEQTLHIATRPAARKIRYITSVQRLDVAGAMGPEFGFAGFIAEVELSAPIKDRNEVAICMAASDDLPPRLLFPDEGRNPLTECSQIRKETRIDE